MAEKKSGTKVNTKKEALLALDYLEPETYDKYSKPIKESVKDFFKDPMQAADARGWIKSPKLSQDEKKDKIKSAMKDPSKFNDLMDEFTNELKPLQKLMKESVKDQIKRAIMEVLKEKKFPDLTGDGKVTRADILKGRGVVLKKELAEDDIDEARFKKGTDIGKKGPGFKKVAAAASKEYGSKEAGQKVAGAILQKVLKKESINYDNLEKDSIADLKSLIDTKKKEREKLNSNENIPPLVQGHIKKLGVEIGKIERELNSRK
jgi:hypothetical protein